MVVRLTCNEDVVGSIPTGCPSVGRQRSCVQATSSPGTKAPDERVTPRNRNVARSSPTGGITGYQQDYKNKER